MRLAQIVQQIFSKSPVKLEDQKLRFGSEPRRVTKHSIEVSRQKWLYAVGWTARVK